MTYPLLLPVTVSLLSLAAANAPTQKEVKLAVERTIPLLQKSGEIYLEKRQCFSCHNQGLPILALTAARRQGFAIDGKKLQRQIEFTADFLRRNRKRYEEGRGTGGQVFTAGYALWALAEANWKPDETTQAVAHYLLQRDQKLGYWQTRENRPPSEFSSLTATFVALRSLQTFASDDDEGLLRQRIDKIRAWLSKVRPSETEERVFKLWALALVQADPNELVAARNALIETQNSDGGWSQLDGKASDAYATGTALVALHRAGGLAVTSPIYRRGLKFLIQTQLGDGSWRVESRSRPFQTYFESGFPHGKHQFISITATSWAVMALAAAGNG
ncbi:MAG: hypothetical protein KatS3mg105_1921 [Gemmatales bacterium]|nr:MAG: hypothetical protein KatS3mg105_1921 [Gemmatales bacterium]